VIPAAADEVAASIAHLFSGYGQDHQKLAGQAAAFHAQFAQNLTKSAASYASAEDAIAAFLQNLQNLKASANSFVRFLTTLTPEDWLDTAIFVLLLPVLIPWAIFDGAVIVLLFLYIKYLWSMGIPFG